ncbi:MAG: CARDB domain-containing protein [Elusimicrobiota bacterium]
MVRALICVLCAFSGLTTAHAQLAGQAVLVLDSSRSPRTSFSTNERATFQQKVSNGAASSGRIYFTFIVADPQLKEVFRHAGNAVPGRVGNAASQLAGVQISSLYTVPGVYKLTARAILDAQVVDQELSFTVSSPNILLIYPPNGAQDVADKPLMFRWSSSGAAKYRITVGDNPSFFNSVYNANTEGNVNAISYPENPADARARLAAGTVYYWRIEGLDANDNVVAQSAVPFSFTVKSASLSRDIAVTGLEIIGKSGDNITFKVTVHNQGGTSESGLQLKFSIGGVPVAGSPVQMPLLSPSAVKTYNFTGQLPPDQGKSLAIGCVEFFDDNVANNCKTMQLTRTVEEAAGDASIFAARKLSNEEIWSAIQELLRDRGVDLTEYSIVGMDKDMTRAELEALLAALRSGQADVSVSGPAGGAADLPSFIPPPVSAGPPPDAPDDLPADKGEERIMTDKELWQALQPPLKGRGFDLTQFAVLGADRRLTASELQILLAAVKSGVAEILVSGPAAPDVMPVAAESAPPAAAPPPPAADEDRQWRGLAPALSKKTAHLKITSNKHWSKVWKRLGGKKTPKIDFAQYMVIGVVAGGEERSDRVEIVEVRKSLSGLRVLYRRVVHRRMLAPLGPQQAAARDLVPYHLRVIPKSGLKIRFEHVSETGGR